ncbi:hypothetical protein K449DRAFT_458016 [Hypoxylon sp. EC38]|nr:hypothetical protein K449DRAFT_458016 [Hypoxylon sp. EC38]
MSESFNLGKLIDLYPGLGPQPPVAYNDTMVVAANTRLDDKDVADKAAHDSKEIPSVWFVNFPDKSAAAQKELLAKYMQSIQDYRCWASLVWWRTVFGNSQIPQDGKRESVATRSAYCARVAVHHMKTTPWLAMNVDHNKTHDIDCKVTDFHAELIKAVLAGFVGVTPSVIKALEGILESLRLTISQSHSNSENKTIVCERYEYISQADVIRSYVRVVSFSVTDSMRNVRNAKKAERWVKCKIEYNDYEASFNHNKWKDASDKISEEQKKAAEDFVKEQTVDCPP